MIELASAHPPRSVPLVTRALVVLLFLAPGVPSRAHGQYDLGVRFGGTTLSELVVRRGQPDTTIRQSEGWFGAHYYGLEGTTSYVFYYAPEDEIIYWARVFPHPRPSRGTVHEAFGAPLRRGYTEDLRPIEFFRRGVTVIYDSAGRAATIEHGRSALLLENRRARALAAMDSAVVDRLVQADTSGRADWHATWDSVAVYRRLARTSARHRKRYSDLLHAVFDSVWAAHRADDPEP